MPIIRPSRLTTTRRRASAQQRLVAVLLVVCRRVRRLQTSAEARAACDDVIRWLREMPAGPAGRGSAD